MSEEPDDLPLGWVSVAVGDVTQTKVEQQGPVGKSEFTYVDISSVNNASKVISDAKQVPIKDAPSRARQRIKSGDVLVSMTRPNLNAVAKVPQELDGAIASTGFDVLRSSVVEPDWIFAHVRSEAFIDSMSELVRGALYPAVNAKEIRDYKIPLPPLPEQRRIVAKIEALQSRSRKARESLEVIPSMLEKFRQSVLAAAFRGDLTADWREQHPEVEPASVLLERIRAERRRQWEKAELAKFKAKSTVPKDDSWKKRYVEPVSVDEIGLPKLPEGWCWAAASQLCEQVANGGTPSDKMTPDSGELPFIKVYNLTRDGTLDFSVNPTFIGRHVHEGQLARSRSRPGDVLMNIVGPPLGKVSIVPPTYPEWNFNQAIVAFRVMPGFKNELLSFYLQTDQVEGWTRSSSKATAG